MEEIIGFDILSIQCRKRWDIYYVIGILSDRKRMSMLRLFLTK